MHLVHEFPCVYWWKQLLIAYYFDTECYLCKTLVGSVSGVETDEAVQYNGVTIPYNALLGIGLHAYTF